MTANVICFASSKGGSGKTTITATIGTFLNEIGKRVLLIDCDEGTHGLTLMFLKEVNESRKKAPNRLLGIFDDFMDATSDDIANGIVEIKTDLHLMPAKHTFSDGDIRTESDFHRNLATVLRYAKENYDYILFDAQAGISAASRSAMSLDFSDTVILVSEYDPMSNAGVERLKARLPEDLDVSRTWVLLNKLLPEFVSKFSEFLSVAKFLPPIPWTADVVRAYSRRKLALDFEGGNQFTLAVLNVLRELMPEDDRPALEAWVSEQTERLRVPISQQIKDSERLLFQLSMNRNSPQFMRVWGVSFYSDLVRNLSYVLALVGALIGVLSIFNLGPNFFENLVEAVSVDYFVSGILIIFGIGMAVAVFFQEGISSKLNEKREQILKRYNIQEDIFETELRIKDLKAIENFDYEELVKRKS